MDERWTIVLCAILTIVSAGEKSIQDCFREDSISCLQMQLFSKTQTLLGTPSIELISGVSLSAEGEPRQENLSEENVRTASDVESRQRALENYLLMAATALWQNRTIHWNPLRTANALVDSMPDSMKTQITTFVGEGRGKNKKQLKMMMPLLVALMLKFAALLALTYMGIAAIAKKAVLAAVVSLVISSFIGIRSLLSSNGAPAEAVGYHHSIGEWDSGYGHSDLLTTEHELAPQRKFFVSPKSR